MSASQMSATDVGTKPDALICHFCKLGRRALGKRLPNGWKREAGVACCKSCWSRLYLLRSVTLPVSCALDCTWDELRRLLFEMWAATTQASNWMLTELYSRDVRRDGQPKMPRMPKVYLYPEARERFPNLPPKTVAAIEQKVTKAYRAARYRTIWTCAASLPTFRYAVPFPVDNQSWTIAEEGRAPVINVRIGDQRVRLRLKNGIRYHRQLEAIGKIIRGQGMRGELSLSRRDADVMCSFVAWLPRPVFQDKRTGILTVRTSSDTMIVAFNTKDERLWTYNGDQLRRWQAEHSRQVQRWAEDTKAENRPVPPFAERRAEAARKYRNRMTTACHTIASLIVNYAVRRKFAGVHYDDSIDAYCKDFPWFDLKSKLIQKCDAVGLSFEDTSRTSMGSRQGTLVSGELGVTCATG